MSDNRIKVGIVGYGNLGRGVEAAVAKSGDMELVGVFTRRDPSEIETATSTPVFPLDILGGESASAVDGSSPEGNKSSASVGEAGNLADVIDVLVLCGGSATDLPVQTPELASKYNVVDSFDTHANIPTHLSNVDAAAKAAGKVALISVGWDPGLFSVARLYANGVLPEGADYTFWGRGVSQGHSDAIRRIDGVVDARQYTVPVDNALSRVRNGETPEFTIRDKHTRECFVVAEEGADLARIESEIVNMPNYFADYDTTVTFVTEEELKRNHGGLPHGGTVIRNGKTGLDSEFNNTVAFSLTLDSNPYFTGSILAAFARATYRLNALGESGCKTIFDIPPVMLVETDREEAIAHLL